MPNNIHSSAYESELQCLQSLPAGAAHRQLKVRHAADPALIEKFSESKFTVKFKSGVTVDVEA